MKQDVKAVGSAHLAINGWVNKMKMDQIAYLVSSREDADMLKTRLGLDKSAWLEDIVTARSWVWSSRGTKEKQINIAQLQFNYSLGIELEILRYLSGPNWHAARNPSASRFAISHIGVHLDDMEDFPKAPGVLVQETWTQKHTSEFLTTGPGKGRLYHYRIYEVSPGSYIKYIKRIRP